ncbi:MAG: hypothetical protein RI894_1057 [Bacteroidota bacterium]
MFFATSILILGFLLTEIAAWTAHKYLMHGTMWFFHEDHHRVGEGHFFEKNDAFFLIFAIPSWLFIMFGIMGGWDWRVWIGFGIAAYGLCYFLVHDVYIHQRFKWFKQIDNAYFRAIRKAHKVHHKRHTKEDGECFGLLWIPLKFYKEAFGRGEN